MIKFLRNPNLTGAHPQGCEGIGIHALRSDKALSLEEIIENHKSYASQYNDPTPSVGAIIRDLGIFITHYMVTIVEEKNENL